MRTSPSFLLVASLAVALGAAPPAAAEGKPTSREKAAKKACITGDVSKGIDLLGDLFVETNDPVHIFNQGRCFEQNHRWSEAIDRFREYLRKAPKLTTTEKSQVDSHISECEAEQAKLAPPPLAPPPLPPPTAAPPPVAPAVTVNVAVTPPPAGPPAPSYLRTVGIVTASLGVVALAGGIISNLYANSLTSDLNKPAGWDRGKASSRDTYELLGWVGYGVGGAALVTGATLFVLGGRSGPTAAASTGVSLAPVLLPGIASLSLRGSY